MSRRDPLPGPACGLSALRPGRAAAAAGPRPGNGPVLCHCDDDALIIMSSQNDDDDSGSGSEKTHSTTPAPARVLSDS